MAHNIVCEETVSVITSLSIMCRSVTESVPTYCHTVWISRGLEEHEEPAAGGEEPKHTMNKLLPSLRDIHIAALEGQTYYI